MPNCEPKKCQIVSFKNAKFQAKNVKFLACKMSNFCFVKCQIFGLKNVKF